MLLRYPSAHSDRIETPSIPEFFFLPSAWHAYSVFPIHLPAKQIALLVFTQRGVGLPHCVLLLTFWTDVPVESYYATFLLLFFYIHNLNYLCIVFQIFFFRSSIRATAYRSTCKLSRTLNYPSSRDLKRIEGFTECVT